MGLSCMSRFLSKSCVGRTLTGAVTLQSTFDALAIAIVALNSFHRPYRRRSDIVSSLLRDGIMWFLVRSHSSFLSRG